MGPSSVVVVIERLVDSLQLRASRFVADQAGNGRIPNELLFRRNG